MEGDMKRGVRTAKPNTIEMKKQTDNVDDLLPEMKKRKRKEDCASRTKTIAKHENAEVPSLMSEIAVIGDSVLQRKKRTIIRRRRLVEMTEPMRRLANAAQRVFLPPKDTNDKPNVRFLIPPSKDKNKLIIRPDEENEPTEHENDENEAKRRRGRPSKLQGAIAGSPRTGRSPNNPTSVRRKQNSDKKLVSLVGRVRHGVNQSGGAHQTPLDKNEPKQLQPRPQSCPLLPPPPQPWPAMSPAWLQSEPYIQPFMNVGSSSTNGADYKGKQVVVDDGNDKGKKPSFENNFDFLFGNPKAGIKINDGSIKNAAIGDQDLVRDFINELSGAKKKPIHIVQDGGNDGYPKKTAGMLQTSQRKNVKRKIHVSPSTYLRPAARKSGGSRLSMGGAATSVQSEPLTQGMQPPKQRDAQAQPLLPWGGQSRLIHDFMTQVQEPPQPPPQGCSRQWAVPDSNDKEIQRCAEAIYGKEAFANGVPPLAGPFTGMMIIALNPECRDALGALVSPREWPPQSTFKTTATHGHQLLPPPPPFTASGHDATGQEELELASTSEPNLLCHNSWAPSNDNLLIHPDTYESVQLQPPPAHMTPPQNHQAPPQLVTNPFLFNNNLFQQHSNMFMPTPMVPPQMAMFGVPNFPGQYLQGYPGSSGGDGNWVVGNWGYQGLPPPPSI